MKRIAAIVLAMLLALTGSALAVYNPATDETPDWEGDVVTLSFTSRLPNIVLTDNPVLAFVEQKTGVRLDISVLDAAQYNSLIAAQIAAGDIPDLLYLWDNSSNANFQQWAANGLLWNLEELEDKLPNALNWVSEADKGYGRVDGVLYGLPRMQQLAPDAIPYRADWLEKFGMDVPVTPEDFWEYCKHCTEDDPDGNGVADTWGVYITHLGDKGGGLIDKNIREGFGIEPETVAYSCIQVQQGFADLMDFYRELYAAGYVYPEFYISNNNYEDSDMFNKGVVGCFFKTTSVDHCATVWENSTLRQLYPDARVIGGYPLQPNGTTLEDIENGEYIHYITANCWGVFCITKNCTEENGKLDAACRYLDWGCTDEGVFILNNGIQGISFKSWDPETRSKTGWTAEEKALDARRSKGYTSYLCVQQSWRNYGKLSFSGNTPEQKAEYAYEYNRLSAPACISYANIDTYPGYGALKQQNTELTTKLNDMMVKYICGNIDAEEFYGWLYGEYCPAWEAVEEIVEAVQGPKA